MVPCHVVAALEARIHHAEVVMPRGAKTLVTVCVYIYIYIFFFRKLGSLALTRFGCMASSPPSTIQADLVLAS